MDEYLDLGIDPDQRITELHAWVATHPGGEEGLISGDVPMPGTIRPRHMPLMSSKRHLAEALLPVVNRVLQLAPRGTRAALVTFRRVTNTEDPNGRPDHKE